MGFADWFGTDAASSKGVADLRRRVAVLEAQVAELARGSGVDLSPVADADPVSPRVHELVRAGRTIEAIKVHREETGLGLAEAKADVDQIAR